MTTDIQKHCPLNELEIMDLATTQEITVQQAMDYINNESNPETYRKKIEDLLNRYYSTIKKHPGRIIMRVNRLGLCDLWMD